jgi:putative xylitol transport system ATP-binding protein
MNTTVASGQSLDPTAVSTARPALVRSRVIDDGVLLHAEGITKRFGGTLALRDGRLTLRRGSVHALCGGNGAGKSTLLNIIMGLLRRDSGRVVCKGREVDFVSPAEALNAGIAIITQELSPVPGMTVAENLYLGREPRRFGCIVDYRRLNAMADSLLRRLRFPVDPTAMMRSLSLAQTQLVEIAKAISCQTDILIMDEPTSAIGGAETELLFEAIRTLAAMGTGIIYVTHRLSEVFDIADEYTVLRDGCFAGTGRVADIDRNGLVALILGSEVKAEQQYKTHPPPAGEPILRVSGLSKRGRFTDISLELRRGEVLGIYGLMGSGRSEFLNALYGIDPADSGRIELDGMPLVIRRPADALAHGFALITEDRKRTGLVLTASVRENISLSSLDRLSTGPFIRSMEERGVVARMIDLFHIRLSSQEAPVRSLSGGNQQKVVLGRCLSTKPRILLCDEPTRGVDVGAKTEIYAFLSQFVADGAAVIMVSSEVPEVVGMSDRIIAFRMGRIAGVLDGKEATQNELLHLVS